MPNGKKGGEKCINRASAGQDETPLGRPGMQRSAGGAGSSRLHIVPPREAFRIRAVVEAAERAVTRAEGYLELLFRPGIHIVFAAFADDAVGAGGRGGQYEECSAGQQRRYAINKTKGHDGLPMPDQPGGLA